MNDDLDCSETKASHISSLSYKELLEFRSERETNATLKGYEIYKSRDKTVSKPIRVNCIGKNADIKTIKLNRLGFSSLFFIHII